MLEPLKQKNVDTGMGLERTICMLNGVTSVYETDFFSDIIKLIESLSGKNYLQNENVTKAMRVIADHIRTATFILGDDKGITPSNVDQGYVLRRLIRRAVRFARVIEMPQEGILQVSKAFVNKYKEIYHELGRNEDKIILELNIQIVLSNPIPVSTFFCFNGSNFPSIVLLYSIKTLFQISTYLPQSQAGEHFSEHFGLPVSIKISVSPPQGPVCPAGPHQLCFLGK